MFAARRIFRNRKTLTKHICTSHVAKCEESKKSDTAPAEKKNKEDDNLRESEPKSHGKINITTAKKMKMTKPRSFESKESRKEPSSNEYKTDLFKKILTSSAEAVAEDLGGNKEKTKADLLEYIKTFEVTKQKPKELMEHYMKPIPKVGDSSSVQLLFNNLKGLNIFKPEKMQAGADDQVKLNIWDALEAEYLEYLSKKSPRNYFEELIQWTNEGKLWHFPINNDQGMEEEAKISFTEHVFLEQHLEPWCPKRGPLRRFMDLVLIGLSKNPYLTVEDKKEHIKWFENYFESKKKLLQELGAFSAAKELGTSN